MKGCIARQGRVSSKTPFSPSSFSFLTRVGTWVGCVWGGGWGDTGEPLVQESACCLRKTVPLSDAGVLVDSDEEDHPHGYGQC